MPYSLFRTVILSLYKIAFYGLFLLLLSSCSASKSFPITNYYTFGTWGSTCVSQYIIVEHLLNDSTWTEHYYHKDSFFPFFRDSFFLSKGQLYSFGSRQYFVDTLAFNKQADLATIINHTTYRERDILTPNPATQDSLELLRQQKLHAIGFPPNLNLLYLPIERLYQDERIKYLYRNSLLDDEFIFDPEQGIIARTVGVSNSVNFCSIAYRTPLPDSILQQLPAFKDKAAN